MWRIVFFLLAVMPVSAHAADYFAELCAPKRGPLSCADRATQRFCRAAQTAKPEVADLARVKAECMHFSKQDSGSGSTRDLQMNMEAISLGCDSINSKLHQTERRNYRQQGARYQRPQSLSQQRQQGRNQTIEYLAEGYDRELAACN